MRTPEQIIGKDHLDRLMFEGYAVVPIDHDKWDTLSGATPIDTWIILWFVGNNAPAAARMPVVGQISSHEPGMVWDGRDYRPVEWFSHWTPMLAPPTITTVQNGTPQNAQNSGSA